MKNFNKLVLAVIFSALISGCVPAGGMMVGAGRMMENIGNNIANLQQPTDTEVKDVIEADQARIRAETQVIQEKQVAAFNEFLTLTTDTDLVVRRARLVFSQTGKDQRVWDAVTDNYFIGKNREAMEWLKKARDQGFALAIVRSDRFSADEKLMVDGLMCDAKVRLAMIERVTLSTKQTKRMLKACSGTSLSKTEPLPFNGIGSK